MIETNKLNKNSKKIHTSSLSIEIDDLRNENANQFVENEKRPYRIKNNKKSQNFHSSIPSIESDALLTENANQFVEKEKRGYNRENHKISENFHSSIPSIESEALLTENASQFVEKEKRRYKLEKNKNLREFRSLFPSTESDALKYENADRVGEKEKRKRRWENVRKDLNINQESNFAIFADFFKSSTPKYDNVDQLLRTWCDASVNPTNRRNERNGCNTWLNDAWDKQARSTGREMEGMVPNHDVNITRDHEYYKYSPSDDGVLLALSDRDRGVHRSYSLRKERELDVPEMNGSETTRPSYATSSLARKSDELCYLHAPVVTRSIPTVDVVAELNRKTLDIFKSQLEAIRRAQDFTAREVYINESVQRV